MDSLTPAIDIKSKDLGRNCTALSVLLEKIPTHPKTVVDVRYGLGGWARVLLKRFPKSTIIGFEKHEPTYEAAWKDSRVSLKLGDLLSDSRPPTRCDLLLCDFNTSTVLKRKELDEVLSQVSCRYLVFTDVCCSKLHLNYRSYGLDSPDLNRYWKKFAVPGFRLMTFSKEHHAASTALYEKTPPK